VCQLDCSTRLPTGITLARAALGGRVDPLEEGAPLGYLVAVAVALEATKVFLEVTQHLFGAGEFALRLLLLLAL